ncbi:MAG: CocE/NonD family hydrolase [Acidobacteriota bacterium]|nr:CocE/NonD family hydrolase [Acidobacteriota bacterium]
MIPASARSLRAKKETWMQLTTSRCVLLSLLIASILAQPLVAQSEIPPDFSPVTEAFDHERREVMVPMRDGVKLHTVIVIPKGGSAPAPIILTRTPYSADKPTTQASSPHASMTLPVADEPLLRAGYIRVYQDVRGRYDSEGDYVMTLPLRGELNRWKVDQTTDTYDTIEWLVKNVERNNGRVGITGVSYPGWLTLMGIIDPHPALKAAVPMYPMVDGWIGDDFYHNGAFRQTMLEWIYNMGSHKKSDYSPPMGYRDMYEAFLSAGSADAMARRIKADRLPTWRKLVDNPSYNAFWRGQAVQDVLAAKPLKVPVLMVHGLFDQEDNFGGIAAYRALESKDTANDMVHLAVGPWNHGQSQHDGSSLGALRWHSDTSLWFRDKVLQPFWDHHLKVKTPAQPTPPVVAFDTGAYEWRTLQSWPAGPAAPMKLHLQPGGALAFAAPTASDAAKYAEYVSDPAKPVPYRVRPVLAMYNPESTWRQWLVDDQRPFADRTDVLTFTSDILTGPLTISGEVAATLFASTTGTDADWVVKLIDLFPPEVRSNPTLGGYQLMVSGEIMRGRYRESLETPKAIQPEIVAPYRVRMPEANHTFLPGHRIMVQIQSTWFPLYDRNPQTFVANIGKAQPGDYRAATQRIWFTPDQASFVELPVVKGATP